MRPFRRSWRRGTFDAEFTAVEVSVLADLVGQVRELLADRRDAAPADDLAALTGMPTAPGTLPEDPALARLLPDFVADDPTLASGLRVLHEPALLAAKDTAAAAVLASLPAGGGGVRLDADAAARWLAALNDVRLALGVRLGMSDDDEVPAAVTADPQGPAAATFSVYRWLSHLQDSLVEAMSATL